jgi:uncharacterized protein Veg
MSRILTLVVLWLGITGLHGQVEMRIEDVAGDVGDTVNVTMYATRAFDLVNFAYPISFDQNKLEYVGFTNARDADIAIDDTQASNGELGISWNQAGLVPAGSYRADFVDIRFVIGAGCRVIDEITHQGSVVPFRTQVVDDMGVLRDITADYFNGKVTTQCTRGMFTLEEITTAPDDTVLVGMLGEDLEDIVGMDFSIFYDSDILEYLGDRDKLFGSDMSVVLVSPGEIKVLWFDPNVAGVDVLLETVLVNFEFHLIGDCATSSTVEFSKEDGALEVSVINSNNDVLLENGIYDDGLVRAVCGPEATVNKVDIACFGTCTGIIQLDVGSGVPPYFFEWSDGNMNEDRTGLCAGIYSVTITDSDNESLEINDIEIVENDEILANVDLDGNCENGNVTVTLNISGGEAPYDIQWSNGETTSPIIISNAPVVLSVTITDDLGCEKIFENIDVPNLADIDLETDISNVTCFGAGDGAIDLTIEGGVDPYSIQWQGPNNFTSSDEDINGLEPGTYSVSVEDQNGCSSLITVEVMSPELPLTVSVDSDSDDGSGNGKATAIVNGGLMPYEYQWSCSSETTPIVENLTAGDCCLTVTDAANCEIVECFSIPTSNNEIQDVIEFSVYPNPFSEIINLELGLKESKLIKAEIFNNLGQSIYQTSIGGRKNHLKINTDNCIPGLYILRLTDDQNNILTKRLTK